MSASKPEHCSATAIRDVPTAADERRQRKRMQNRLNQRAFRSRTREKENAISKKPKKRRQYHIGCWRLDELEDQLFLSAQAPSNSRNSEPSAPREAAPLDQLAGTMTTTFPLPLDHTLLHLVKYNVFRGLVENKMILDRLTMQYQITNKIRTGPFSYFASFPNSSVILPVVPNPSARSLTPTASQMTMVHSSWINVLPFPAMRENMIKWESDFDHSELVKDLVGNLINLKLFPSVPPSSSRRPAHAGRQIVLQEGDDGEPTAITEPGLILWGEPYRAESWEATPEFLQKWAWAVAGSRELIDSTNYWRSRRGENPLRLVSVDDGASP